MTEARHVLTRMGRREVMTRVITNLLVVLVIGSFFLYLYYTLFK